MYQRAQRRIESIRATAAAIGWGNALLYALSRVLSSATGGRARIVKYDFVVQPVEPPPARAATRTGKFTLDWAGNGSPLFGQIARPPAVIASRFAQHARCIAASVEGGRLAGFLWFVVGPYDEDEVRVRFVPAPEGAAAWDFDVTILPEYRMGRLFAALWARATAELAALGVRYTCSRISAFNAGSLASHRRLGAHKVGSATFVCLGRVEFMASSLGPQYRLTWRDDQRPVLTVAA